jgi:hypothetical protein
MGDVIVGAVLSAILLLTLIAFPRHLKSVVICLLLIWTVTAAFVIYDGLPGCGIADPRQLPQRQ